MIPMICVDEELGMTFEKERLLDSEGLRKRIQEISSRDRFWMNSYSAEAFAGMDMPTMIVDDDFLEKAGPDDYVLVEDQPLAPYLGQIRRVLLYRLDRHMDATRVLDLDIDKWSLMVAEDLPTEEGMFTIEVMKP